MLAPDFVLSPWRNGSPLINSPRSLLINTMCKLIGGISIYNPRIHGSCLAQRCLVPSPNPPNAGLDHHLVLTLTSERCTTWPLLLTELST